MVPDGPERIYDEVTDLAHLTQQMEGWVDGVTADMVILFSGIWIPVPLAVFNRVA